MRANRRWGPLPKVHEPAEKGAKRMLITSKGRYALRLMIIVAASGEGAKVTQRQVADSENISLKYLEQLAHTLVKANLLASVRGHGGGYRLAREAASIKAGDVIRAAEGTTAPVACAGLDDMCPRESMCSTVAFWAGLDEVIENYVDGVTLADLAQTSFSNLIPMKEDITEEVANATCGTKR